MPELTTTKPALQLTGLREHNLQNIDLTIPLHQLVVLAGVSGSGKSSLAYDTLYIEGQRRFNETLSPQLRQLLGTFTKPDVDEINYLPPTVTLKDISPGERQRATVASLTEITDSLATLFTRLGEVVCPTCHQIVQPETTESVLQHIHTWPDNVRFQICFSSGEPEEHWRELGFTRTVPLQELPLINLKVTQQQTLVIVDRLITGKFESDRVLESLEQAFQQGNGTVILLWEEENSDVPTELLQDKHWRWEQFSDSYQCTTCNTQLKAPHPQLFNENSPWGRCDNCQGKGTLWFFDLEKVIPDESLSLTQGAIALAQEPRLGRLQIKLEKMADDLSLSTALPLNAWTFSERSQFNVRLESFLKSELADRPRFKTPAFREAWLREETCPACSGKRFSPASLAVHLNQTDFTSWLSQPVKTIQNWIKEINHSGSNGLEQIILELKTKLGYLTQLGLEELTLDRRGATLSIGERKLVQMAGLLSIGLVNTLYVLDEPSRGLHPDDQKRLLSLLQQLKADGNSLLIVEHSEIFWKAADQLIELGPGAGNEGGQQLFQGDFDELVTTNSPTGNYLRSTLTQRTKKQLDEFISLSGVKTNNLKSIDAQFPLNAITVVCGISGSGKSSLVQHTLFPRLSQELGQNHETVVESILENISGADLIEEVIWVAPERKTNHSRSVVATLLKVYSYIRQEFSETTLARSRNLSPGDFSFNSKEGGRCEECEGKGSLEVEMAFLADLSLVCPRCEGKRFRADLLEVQFRGLNLNEVLNLQASEAFEFFRKLPAIQKRLQVLMELGLGYLELGRTIQSLSQGEQQRLRLAELLLQGTRARTMFLIEEPTAGLHPVDFKPLMNYFERLLEIGHTLVLIDNHPVLTEQADHVIELGPGRGTAGGMVLNR